MPDPRPHDGPSMEDYVETRFRLLDESRDKLEAAMRERISAVEAAGVAQGRALAAENDHTKQLLTNAQKDAQRATDKAEDIQKQHNQDANNWRAEYNRLNAAMATKDEVVRIDRAFDAYRLEVSTIIAAGAAEKAAKNSGQDDNRWNITTIISLAVAAVAVLALVMGHRL